MGKYREYVGLSNGKVVDETVRPRALKDSTAAYINDYKDMKNKSAVSIVEYNLKGIEESIVPSFSRFDRLSNSNKYSVVGKTKSSYINLAVDKVKHEVKKYLNTLHGLAVINYLTIDKIEYGHFLKTILVKDKKYNPTTNMFDDMWYLDDAVIYSREELDFKYLGLSFASGKTPFRIKDETRGYTPWIVDKTIKEEYAKVFYIAEGIKVTDIVTTIIEKYYYDASGNKQITNTTTSKESTVISDTSNVLANKELIEQSEEKVSNTNSVKENNPNDYTSTTVIVDRLVEKFKLTKDEHITLPNFYLDESIVPDEIEGIDSPSAFDKNKLVDFINAIENNELIVHEYVKSSYLILVCYSYKENGIDKINYLTITDKNYPEITDNLFDGNSFGNLASRIYFKIYGQDLSKTNYPDWHKQSVKAAAKLGIDYDNFYEKIKENIDNYSTIRASYINFGINIDGTSQIELKYLTEYFLKLVDVSKDTIVNLMDGNRHEFNPVFPTYKDNYSVGSIECKLISVQLKTGIITNNYTKGSDTSLSYETYKDNSEFLQTDIIYGKVFNKRISDNEYLEVTVYDLIRKERITSSLWKYNDDKADLLIPLDIYIMETFFKSFKEKEELIYKSMYLEFHTYVRVKKKWYERGIFKAVVFVASVVIGVMTGGAGFSIQAIAQAAATTIATMIVTNFLMQAIVKAFNPELARKLGMVLAIAAIAYGGYGAINSGTSIIRATTIFFTRITNLMKLSGMFLQASNIRLAQDLQKEEKDYRARMKTLDEMKQEILGNQVNSMVSYLGEDTRTYIASNIILGETIDEYIARYLDYRKWEVPINYTHEYADYIKQLPTFDETLRQRLNEQQLYVNKEKTNE